MNSGARAGRGAVGRLLLLLLLALGLMHLLAHAGGADTGPEKGTAAAHAHTRHVEAEPTAPDDGAAPPLAVVSGEHSHPGTSDTAGFGLCVAVIGCCALLAAGGRRLHGRRFAVFLYLRRRVRAAWRILRRPPRPRRSPSVDITQLAVLRI
ncbi:hypothetical protein [Streptomyces neyagawaensis]|nr:hypothetical protein [Streptomyces neyagawaensis]